MTSPRFRSWPITSTKALEPQLKSMGLQIPSSEIDGTSSSRKGEPENFPLSDALVSVGQSGRGGTGSFISMNGLIITNWHVAYDAVRQASIATDGKHDYVNDGFVANSMEEEIRGPNYEVWITKSCVDVSNDVVDVIKSETDPLVRSNKVRDKMQEIAKTAQEGHTKDKDGGIRCDVQEMLPNTKYVLFTYERLKDVRIVYVPPKALGNFGGDTDNFEWPRHTADFTLLRAYVGPDGGAADYSPNNVPYKSKARIKVQKDGANDGDFVFLLGFPGRTMRYAPASRLQYSDEVAVPRMINDFSRKLQLISEHETASETARLKLGGTKKGLANELKRSKGKLVMMKKLRLLSERKSEEDLLVSSEPEAKATLDRLQEIYDTFRSTEPVSSVLESMRGIYGGSSLLAAGHSLHEYVCIEKEKSDEERESSYRERNLPFLLRRLGKRLGDIHIPYETAVIEDAIQLASTTLGCDKLHKDIISILGNERCDIAGAVHGSILRNYGADTLPTCLNDENLEALKNDPFFRVAKALWSTYKADRDQSKALISERDALFAKLLEFQTAHSNDEEFYPDCNGSLRISAGHVEGYSAADAIEMVPKTCLAGVLEKAVEAKLLDVGDETKSEFDCPERLLKLLMESSNGDNNDDNVLKVPVNLLYSTDTVGGNSGSPVMNGKGEFVAINFDRQRQGLMNEFKWSKDFSRSIGVDVRYILWLIGTYDKATHLVDEMIS